MNLESRLRELSVVPVVAIEDAAHALPLADALAAGGLPVAEITFRTRAAAEVIRALAAERPDLLVGAGTVLTPAQAELAKECGAAFAVAPGFNPEVVKAAQGVGLPFFPGVMTPSDVEGALSLGCAILKFFPAAQAGGPAMLSALSGPYAHTGLRFMPTGGITPATLHEYLAVKTVVAAGGTWIAKTEAIREGQWDVIAENARQVSALLASLGRR